MPENLMNSAHKATNEAYRRGHDAIRWDGQEEIPKMVRIKIEELAEFPNEHAIQAYVESKLIGAGFDVKKEFSREEEFLSNDIIFKQ